MTYVSSGMLNSTIPSASDLPLGTIKCCSVAFNIVVHAGCDKQYKIKIHWCVTFCTVNRHQCYKQQTTRQLTVETVDCSSPVINPKAKYSLPHLDLTPLLAGSCRNIAITFGQGKTRVMWLPDDEKILKICLFISLEYTNVTDGWTERHILRVQISFLLIVQYCSFTLIE